MVTAWCMRRWRRLAASALLVSALCSPTPANASSSHPARPLASAFMTVQQVRTQTWQAQRALLCCRHDWESKRCARTQGRAEREPRCQLRGCGHMWESALMRAAHFGGGSREQVVLAVPHMLTAAPERTAVEVVGASVCAHCPGFCAFARAVWSGVARPAHCSVPFAFCRTIFSSKQHKLRCTQLRRRTAPKRNRLSVECADQARPCHGMAWPWTASCLQRLRRRLRCSR